MQNVIPDERYSVADEAILGAFFKLLKEKKPDRITVSDITKTAGIARSTFYNHYQDIPSLISAVEDKTIHDVFSMMENFQPKNDRDICSSYFLTLCRYTMENPFLSGLLSTPHGNDLFEKMLTMLHHYVTETTSNSGSKFQNGDTLLARITPCLENGKTAYVSGLKSSEGAVGSTEYIVMRAKTINAYMVYLLARTDDFRQSAINSMSGSDGRQRVKSDKLKMLDYLHPTSELVEKFENEKIYRLSKQMQQAKQARDLLLPKLMSGEVEV